ncbi:transcriptional repressor LexA [Trueperella bialowiezensis]|uniref:LexA repressor n=1 Tax=Trueperella bialowiezensis TaxID=312285 RepID=A0A3S4V9K8_9ACTO|nr:transcriptional repressor LexA [Trueperella bialowiezensis]VEI12620.1 LexA repressor [Trueperella bialowiezensis]
MADVKITKRQQDILRSICTGVAKNGYPPTVREIGEEVGLKSSSSVKYQLDTLEELGCIQRDPRRPRTLEVTELGYKLADFDGEAGSYRLPLSSVVKTAAEPREEMFRVDETEMYVTAPINVPAVGRIAAGGPILAEELIDDIYPLPRQFTGTGDFFMLEVSGDSMIDAAICDGDWVVIRRQHTAENGEIVAALIDGEATVKVFMRKDGHLWLMPRNSNYAPIAGDEAEILGKVVTVIRAL